MLNSKQKDGSSHHLNFFPPLDRIDEKCMYNPSILVSPCKSR